MKPIWFTSQEHELEATSAHQYSVLFCSECLYKYVCHNKLEKTTQTMLQRIHVNHFSSALTFVLDYSDVIRTVSLSLVDSFDQILEQ